MVFYTQLKRIKYSKKYIKHKNLYIMTIIYLVRVQQLKWTFIKSIKSKKLRAHMANLWTNSKISCTLWIKKIKFLEIHNCREVFLIWVETKVQFIIRVLFNLQHPNMIKWNNKYILKKAILIIIVNK